MSLPDAYTETTLAQYMHNALGQVAVTLDYDPGSSYAEAINETLLAYGVDEVSEASDLRKLRALARVQAWSLAAADTAGDYDFKTPDGTFNRSQVHAQCLRNLQAAQTEAAEYTSDFQVQRSKLKHIHDPYQYWDEEDRVR